MIQSNCVLLLGLALSACIAPAQTAQDTSPATRTNQVPRVEMAVPFGTLTGRLVTTGPYVIFVDDQNIENSFVVERQNITDVRNENGGLTFQLKRPVPSLAADRTNLSFRMLEGGSSDGIIAWFKQPGTGQRATGLRRATGATADEPLNAGAQPVEAYPAKHEHRIGSCNGRLLIYPDRVVYESVSDSGDSRQWPLREIKDIKQKSPYRLRIGSFAGDDYTFELLGKQLDTNEYRGLVDRIARARASQ